MYTVEKKYYKSEPETLSKTLGSYLYKGHPWFFSGKVTKKTTIQTDKTRGISSDTKRHKNNKKQNHLPKTYSLEWHHSPFLFSWNDIILHSCSVGRTSFSIPVSFGDWCLIWFSSKQIPPRSKPEVKGSPECQRQEMKIVGSGAQFLTRCQVSLFKDQKKN